MNTKEYLVQNIVSQMTIYLMNDYNWDMQTVKNHLSFRTFPEIR
jgi:rRNA maturation endonuclease Nob1